MTVASLAIAAFGAVSNAFLMGSVVSFLVGSVVCACADALIATAITPSTNREISFMCVLLAMPQNLGVENPRQYTTTARTLLLNSSADGQAARYALGNRPVERVIAQSP